MGEQEVQLEWILEQLARPEVQLVPEEHVLVKSHRLAYLELLQQQLHGLGPGPVDPEQLGAWERRKAEATSEVNLVAESWRLQTPGLGVAWEKLRRTEELQKLRAFYGAKPSSGPSEQPSLASPDLQQAGAQHMLRPTKAC